MQEEYLQLFKLYDRLLGKTGDNIRDPGSQVGQYLEVHKMYTQLLKQELRLIKHKSSVYPDSQQDVKKDFHGKLRSHF